MGIHRYRNLVHLIPSPDPSVELKGIYGLSPRLVLGRFSSPVAVCHANPKGDVIKREPKKAIGCDVTVSTNDSIIATLAPENDAISLSGETK